ncbi:MULTISPECIES: hypothetical protein [unclassified Streptomyces]|uniref:hypothetical protein n=1 Tax=unclassified Streptomyces TaxID=2593676 RepID=UPI0035DCA517
MRPAQDLSGGLSATPIYDALYSEFRRSFRTLPGDRSGEEELSFRSFGSAVTGGRRPHSGTGTGTGSGWVSAYALPPGSGSGL